MKAAKPNRRKCREAAMQVVFCENFCEKETVNAVAATQGAATIEMFQEAQGHLKETVAAAEAGIRALDGAIKLLGDMQKGMKGQQLKPAGEGTFGTISFLAHSRRETMMKLQRVREMLDQQESVFAEKSFTTRLLRIMDENRDKIDTVVDRALQRWTLKRLTGEDRALLQLGVAELLFMEDVPPLVIIDEYVELAKLYSDKEGPGLINGVLDAVRKEHVTRT